MGLGIVIVSGLFFYPRMAVNRESTEAIGSSDVSPASLKAVMYKEPTCGCCVKYAPYLESNNFDVKMVAKADTTPIKEENNIPYDVQSCHTLIVGDYFVEGHVPLEAIEKLLAEKSDVDRIALPGMPAGSPGMPGVKSEEFVIYALKDGVTEEFMRI